MKFKSFFFIALFIANHSQAQILKIQTGASFSNLDWTLNTMGIKDLYHKMFVGHSLFLGLDYLEHKRYNLSSNVGLLQKGGADEFPEVNSNGDLTGNMVQDRASLNYISFNTCIDYNLSKSEALQNYISIGPRIDYLYSYSKHFNGIADINALKNISAGLIIGTGTKLNLNKFQVGLRADYYLNANKVADWPASPYNAGGQIKSNTFTLNLTFGYKLKS